MIPAINDILTHDIELVSYPSQTHKMHLGSQTISGFIDGKESVKQMIYKILNTERYEYIAYTWNFGLYTSDLFGEDYDYVCAELERRITEALLFDDRINGVEGFEFSLQERNKVLCTFSVNTTFGTIDSEKAVNF